MLTLEGCRARQQRLRREMANAGWDAVVVTSAPLVYYFTGVLGEAKFPQLVALSADATLLISNSKGPAAADSVLRYERYSIGRVISRSSMLAEVVQLARRAWRSVGIRAVAIEPFAPREIAAVIAEKCPGAMVSDAGSVLASLRRCKLHDEVESIRKVAELLESGYKRVRPMMQAGRTECEIYSAFHAAVVERAGTGISLIGDFAAGSRALEGGPPTSRLLQAGDTYTLDVFPCIEGYHADLCRTFTVGAPSSLQRDAWRQIVRTLETAESMIRPGTRGADLYAVVKAKLDEFTPTAGSFFHHAGHGIGLEAQEFPWIMPSSDHVLVEGDVIAIEPGLYSPELHAGIRLEQNYVVTGEGFQRLSSFPLEL